MRAFIDVRFYLEGHAAEVADDVAEALAKGKHYADRETFRVASHRTLGYGGEGDDGSTVDLSQLREIERTH